MDQPIKIIVFQLNGQEYGADIQQISSIEKLGKVVELPQTSDFIKGVINLRGQVTPVIDLKNRMNLGEAITTDETRVLIASIEENVQVGLIVDTATDVIDVDQNVIEKTPTMVNNVNTAYLKGVVKLENRLLLLLDLARVLNYQEVNEVKQAVTQ